MPRSVLGDFIAAQSAVAAGDMTGGTNVMRQAMSKVDWSKRNPMHVYAGWSVYTHKGMSYGWAWVDTASHRIVVSDSTLDTLQCYGPALLQFLEDMSTGASGMKHVTMDTGAYAEAARAEAEYGRGDVVVSKDAMVELGERVAALIAQASSMQGGTVTDLQLRTFLQRYAEAQIDAETLGARMTKLNESLETAGRLIAALG